MDTRREFLRKTALLSGGAAVLNMLPPVIQKALAIDPEPGSTFYDAEHIVFLMQENRSFDHIFGNLQGVRGYNDPRAIHLPNGNRVWLQSTGSGDTYAPFHLSTRDTKVAWMGSLPHGWSDQTDARNEGKYDRWLEVKRARRKDYADLPLTLGYCDRSDFPFYYSLADAFTVCDQSFCSSITGTHPNRYYWMSGSVRDNPADVASKAHLWNITDYNKPELGWKTFPERLEENGISWKIYQNELTMGFGLDGEDWLSNFGTNVLEYFRQYNVRLHPGSIANLQTKKDNISRLIADLEKAGGTDDASQRKLAAARKVLAGIEADQAGYTTDRFNGLSSLEKTLNEKAFTTNIKDPFYHDLTSFGYEENGTQRTLNIPKGDLLHQFREDVENGRLPTVSWLSSPANFSDHPSEPWFGPWYVSEVMDILLKNPEVWKKTVFILTYDENDGYYDHVPPFVVPDPYKDHTGKVSKGIDPRMDFATRDQQVNPSASADRIREAPIGLGYRIPMVIASPWTRGGFVCSEVFDHTSSLQFLETFLAKKSGKNVREGNITQWRRTVCGDLTSAFRPYNGQPITRPEYITKEPFLENINEAQFKGIPDNYRKLTPDEIAQINTDPLQSPWFPRQEKGTRPACALPYELYVNGRYDSSANRYTISFQAANIVFGQKAAGSPFYVYALTPYQSEILRCWNYAVAAGDSLEDEWDVQAFDNARYHLRVYGPNGFYREFKGDAGNPGMLTSIGYEHARLNPARLTGNLVATVINKDMVEHRITITDNGYKAKTIARLIPPGSHTTILLDLSKQQGWYDFSLQVHGHDGFEERVAGKVETGTIGKTDPLMGGMV
jgi:phospholipase C